MSIGPVSCLALTTPIDATRLQRVREIEAVLNPDRSITYPHVGRAIDLAIQYRWNVRHVGHIQMAAQLSTRTIFSTPLYGDREFALFCHEGGHLEDPHWSSWPTVQAIRDGEHYTDSLHAERVAWQFALTAAGFCWNKPMHAVLRESLASYRRHYRADAAEERTIDALIAQSDEKARGVVRVVGDLRTLMEG